MESDRKQRIIARAEKAAEKARAKVLEKLKVKTMTPAQYNAALKKLDLSIVGASVLGLSPRQCQRIAAGTSPVPKSLEHLLNVMIKHNIKPEELKN